MGEIEYLDNDLFIKNDLDKYDEYDERVYDVLEDNEDDD